MTTRNQIEEMSAFRRHFHYARWWLLAVLVAEAYRQWYNVAGDSEAPYSLVFFGAALTVGFCLIQGALAALKVYIASDY